MWAVLFVVTLMIGAAGTRGFSVASSCMSWGFMMPAAMMTASAFAAWGLLLVAFVVAGGVVEVSLFVIVSWVSSYFNL